MNTASEKMVAVMKAGTTVNVAGAGDNTLYTGTIIESIPFGGTVRFTVRLNKSIYRAYGCIPAEEYKNIPSNTRLIDDAGNAIPNLLITTAIY